MSRKKTGIFVSIIFLILFIWYFNSNTKYNDPWLVDSKNLEYYSSTYEKNRFDFQKYAKLIRKNYPRSKTVFFKIPSENNDDLTLNAVYIPPKSKTSKIIILTSGIHGIEGFVGSAIQKMFVKEFLLLDPQGNLKKNVESLDANTGYLIIHAINPWGFKHKRRVSQNNVDLNRNSSLTTDLYFSKNDGYEQLDSFLNPKLPLDTSSLKNQLFFFDALLHIIKYSTDVLRQAILQGQYEYPQGIIYGGKKQEPQILFLQSYLKSVLKPYSTILIIDIHTGYGKRGVLHFFPSPAKTKKIKEKTDELFRDYEIDWGDKKDFYTVTGDFIGMIVNLYPDKNNIPMVFEFGTKNSQTTMGSIDSLHTMIMENQGFHFAYKDEESEQEIKKQSLEMYFPSSESWRSHVIETSREVLRYTLENLKKM